MRKQITDRQNKPVAEVWPEAGGGGPADTAAPASWAIISPRKAWIPLIGG